MLKTIVIVSFFSLSMAANAITSQISGTLVGFQWSKNVNPIPKVLNDLNGTPFNAFLYYDERALPTTKLPHIL